MSDNTISSPSTNIDPSSPDSSSSQLQKASAAVSPDENSQANSTSNPSVSPTPSPFTSPAVALAPAVPAAVDPLAEYEAAVRSLIAQKTSPSAVSVLEALLARDQVDRYPDHGIALGATEVERLAKLDASLRSLAVAIDSTHAPDLASWKTSMDPASERWWWSLHDLAVSDRVKLRPRTALLVTILLGLSFVITGDTVGQLLKVAAISAGVVAIVIQASLTFMMGNVLTEAGRKWVLNLLSGFGLNRTFRDMKVRGLALGVFGLSILAWWLLPILIVKHYVAQGDSYGEKSEWTQAIESYKRALVLRPSDLELHSKQAVAYDKSFQFDHARDEYKVIVESDGTQSLALNNLARLFIIDKSEVPALRLLDQVTARIPTLQREEKYFVFKNRGWAKLGLQLYEDAESDLRAAIKAREDGAAAHYLLGQVLDELKKPDEARKHFERMLDIIAHDPASESDLEPDWIIRAERRIR